MDISLKVYVIFSGYDRGVMEIFTNLPSAQSYAKKHWPLSTEVDHGDGPHYIGNGGFTYGWIGEYEVRNNQ